MRKPVSACVAAVLVMGLAACGGQNGDGQGRVQTEPDAPAEAEAAPRETAAAAMPPAFFQCRSCHSVEPGRHMIGPSLAGIFGTRSGDVAGYNFSPAMKEAGIVWDEATLDAYIKAPRETVPGTKMIYPGLKNDERRAEVVAYLKSLEAPAP